jgi:hypothetical protein
MLGEVISVIELWSAIVACFAHDVRHPGLTNRFLVMKKHRLANIYNDSTVLENMHAATVFQMTSDPKMNIFSGFTDSQWAQSRKIIIEMILATEMGKHFDILGLFRVRALSSQEIVLEDESDRLLVYSMILK